MADVIDINPNTSGVVSSYAGRNQGMALVNNKLYFVAYDTTYGNEVRWIDTTIANPTAADVNPIDLSQGAGVNGDSIPLQSTQETFSNRFFLVSGNRIYFAATDSTYGNELRWIDTDLDPNVVNTIDTNTAGGSNVDTVAGYAIVNNKLFFSATDPQHGQELRWLNVPSPSSDPHTKSMIPATDVNVVDINTDLVNPGLTPTASSNPGAFSGFASVGNKLYFTATTSIGAEPHWVDASPQSGDLIDNPMDLAGGTANSKASQWAGYTVVGNRIFFDAARSYGMNVEDFVTYQWIDTTDNSVHMIDKIDGNTFFAQPEPGRVGGVALVNNLLFMPVRAYESTVNGDVDYGIELAWVDATATTPTMHLVDDFYTGTSSSLPGLYGGFASIGNNLYYYAQGTGNTFKLRELDTTKLNTPSLAVTTFDVSPGIPPQGTVAHNSFIVDGTRLFFNGNVTTTINGSSVDSGNELIWIDSAGDRVPHLVDINSGTPSSNPGKFGNFAIANGNLYFPVESNLDGDELGKLFIGIPPKVDSIVFGDGTAQRSMVKSITVTFSEDVTIDSGAFVLQSRVGTTLTSYSASQLTINVSTALVSGKTVATLTFTGSLIIGGSLFDGNWELTILADHVRDAEHQYLDGDSNGAGGDNYVKGAIGTDNFFRLFGDFNGTRGVENQDLKACSNANGTHTGDPGYIAAFDYDGDGDIDSLDQNQINIRYRSRVNP